MLEDGRFAGVVGGAVQAAARRTPTGLGRAGGLAGSKTGTGVGGGQGQALKTFRRRNPRRRIVERSARQRSHVTYRRQAEMRSTSLGRLATTFDHSNAAAQAGKDTPPAFQAGGVRGWWLGEPKVFFYGAALHSMKQLQKPNHTLTHATPPKPTKPLGLRSDPWLEIDLVTSW